MLSNIMSFSRKASYWGLIAFSASLFLQPTPNAICFVLGVLAWILSGVYYNPKLKVLNYFVLAQMFLELIFHFIHPLVYPQNNQEILIIAKDLFKEFSPWFWFTSVIGSISAKLKRKTIFVFIGFGCAISLLCFIQSFGLFENSRIGPSGLQHQPYTTGALILISFFLSLHLLFLAIKSNSTKKKVDKQPLKNSLNLDLKLILFMALFVQTIGILAISQRAIMLGLLAGSLFWILVNRKLFNAQVFISLFSLGLFSLPGAYFLFPKFRNRLTTIFNPAGDKTGLGCRLEIWKQNWESFKTSIFIGHGKAIEFNCYGDNLNHAHNIYLQKLVASGLIGFTLWMSFLTTVVFKLISRRHNSAIIACLIALFIEGIFENWNGDGEIISAFWFLLSIGLA